MRILRLKLKSWFPCEQAVCRGALV